MIGICVATEDQLSETVAEKLLAIPNGNFHIEQRFRKNGNGYLKKRLPNFNEIARFKPVFLLTDLDDRPCASELIYNWCAKQVLAPKLLFRVAVREIEAWLLADRECFAELIGVSPQKMPQNPEALPDPKRELMNLVKRSRNRELKREVLPDVGVKAKFGLGYNNALGRFVRDQWDPHRAARYAPSLEKAMARIAEL